METKTKAVSVKSQARKLIDKLPASASWDDVMQQIFVRQKIEAGLADLNAGRLHSQASIKREFGVA
jgi:predicted transcriptional regulator